MGQEPTTTTPLGEELSGSSDGAPSPSTPAPTQPAEAEFARFFEQSSDLHCVAGVDGYFKRVNPAWVSALGWTVEELQARPFLSFVHVDDRESTMAEVSKLATGAETVSFPNRYMCKDGSYRWLEWDARSAVGRGEIYATARDITYRRQLEREILEIADRERERLGRDLHDGLCQTLAGIAALSVTLSRRLARLGASASAADGTTDLADASAEIARLLNEAISEARDLARALGPVGLEQAGLDVALSALAVNVERTFRVSCRFACDRPFVRLPRGVVAAHLFRIVQQAVNNAVVHGHPDRIDISLGSKDGVGLLSVRDNGVGVPGGAHNPEGIGLHTMAQRARLIGGRLEVQRQPQGGTAVICAFPLSGQSDTGDNTPHDSADE